MYKENIKKICLMTAIGFAIGFLLMFIMDADSDFGSKIIMAIVLSGVPYGWTLINKVSGGLGFAGPIYVVIFVYILKFIVSIFLGWVATAVVLIYNFVMLFLENKKI